VRWLDVAGPPGVGKSTLCDERWPPRAIEYDGEGYPEDWREFLDCTDWLLGLISRHESIAACKSMIRRSFRKMATVSRIDSNAVYVQTGLAQRGLGIGWRLVDTGQGIEPLAEYYRSMPVSLGVVILTADVTEIQRRNVARGKDRAFMVPPMAPPLRLAVDVLAARGVPVVEIDTGNDIDDCRARLAGFERECINAADIGALRHPGEVALHPASG
jgi:hypothetical protein